MHSEHSEYSKQCVSTVSIVSTANIVHRPSKYTAQYLTAFHLLRRFLPELIYLPQQVCVALHYVPVNESRQ